MAAVAGAAALSCVGGVTDPNGALRVASGYAVTAATLAPVAGAAVTITAVLSDSTHNPIPRSGVSVTWSATGTGGTFGTPKSVTDSTGTATVQFTTSGTVGSYVVTATDSSAIKGSSPTITSVAGAATSYVVTTSNAAPVAGAAVTITAKLADANGNLVATSGRTVTWTTTGTGATFATPTTLTDATGSAAVQFTTGTTVGSYVVTGTDNTALKGSSPSIATVPGAASVAKSTLTGSPASLPADGASKSTITLQAADANGNVVHASAGVALMSLISSPAGTTISATTDNLNGTYTAQVTAPSANVGSAIVGATLAGAGVTSRDTVTIATNSGTQYLVTSSAPSPTAGSGVTISAQLANSSGVPVTTGAGGKVVTWSVTGVGGTFGAPTSTTSATGLATVTFTTATTAGLATVKGTDAGALTGSVAVTSVAGAVTHYVVTSTSTSPVAGAAVTVTAQATDANNNAASVSGTTITWSAVGETGGTFNPTTSLTSATGAATTSYTTGTSVGTAYTIGAQDASAHTGNVSVTNTAGTPSSLTWTRASRIVVTDTAYSAAAFTGVNQFGRTVAPAVTYTSRTAAAATVSAAGLATPVARGLTMLVGAATANAAATDSVLLAIATTASPVVRTDLTRFDLKNDTTFTVTVIADMRSATLLGAATVSVTWDPTQLTYVSDADGASGVGATVNSTNAANGTLVLSAANSTGFGGTVELRKVTFTAGATIGKTGSLHLLVTSINAAGTFASLSATTLAVTYPLVLR